MEWEGDKRSRGESKIKGYTRVKLSKNEINEK